MHSLAAPTCSGYASPPKKNSGGHEAHATVQDDAPHGSGRRGPRRGTRDRSCSGNLAQQADHHRRQLSGRRPDRRHRPRLRPAVQQATGQQVIIDNKPGASGNIGAALVARSPADGYTFLHSVSSTLIQNRVMFKQLGFDPDKDYTIVSGTSSGVLPVVVHKSMPAGVKDLKSFIAYAKGQKINWGSWALGSSSHIFAQRLNEKYGLSIEVVTYKGEAPMWQDMGAGSLQAAMGSPQAMNALLVKQEVRPIVAPSRSATSSCPTCRPRRSRASTIPR